MMHQARSVMLQDLQRLLHLMNTCVVLRSTGSQKLWKVLVGVWQI